MSIKIAQQRKQKTAILRRVPALWPVAGGMFYKKDTTEKAQNCNYEHLFMVD